MKTYFKTFLRTFRKHATRLVSIVLMVLISIGFSAGVGMATGKLDAALDNVYRERNCSDLIVKSTRSTGFTDEERAILSERYASDVMFASSLEFEGAAMTATAEADVPFLPAPVEVTTAMRFTGVEEGPVRVYFFDAPKPEDVGQNTLKTVTYRENAGESITVYAERDTYQFPDFTGKTLHADVTTEYHTPFGVQTEDMGYDFYVAGTVENPLHLAVRDDVCLAFEDGGKQKELCAIFYLFGSELAPAANDAYIRLERRFPAMRGGYETYVNAEKAALAALLDPDDTGAAEILTLYENFTFRTFHEYGGKIMGIGYVLMAVFLLVTLLVVLSTMTRLLDEERAQIACMQTLGYPTFGILSKYLLFAFVGTVLGGGGAYLAALGLAYIVYINFNWNYSLPAYPLGNSAGFFFIVASVMLVATLAATAAAGVKMMRRRPAELMRPKAPRPGKKVILEHIPLVWERLSFKYKSSLRNVLRFKMRFIMTVVAVMASTALVLAGLAVLDCCLFQDVGTAAMIGVAVIVLLFAALLNAVVIYTLTNINISERSRELATLMVLGYYDNEVTGYIYREIYITGAIGIALGLPFGCLLCLFVFNVMGFGSIPAIGWYVWLAAPLLSLLFTFLVTLILRHRILKIDMNSSLKAVE